MQIDAVRLFVWFQIEPFLDGKIKVELKIEQSLIIGYIGCSQTPMIQPLTSLIGTENATRWSSPTLTFRKRSLPLAAFILPCIFKFFFLNLIHLHFCPKFGIFLFSNWFSQFKCFNKIHFNCHWPLVICHFYHFSLLCFSSSFNFNFKCLPIQFNSIQVGAWKKNGLLLLISSFLI